MAKSSREPSHLSFAITEIVALRGLAREQGNVQLEQLWRDVAGIKIAGKSKAISIRRGILQVEVFNASLLNELVAFHKPALLQAMKEQHSDQKIRDIKFKLRGRMPNNE